MASPKVVLITGSSVGGIGGALVEEYAREGCIVFASARRLESMNSLEMTGDIRKIRLDVNDDAGRADLLELCFRLHNLRTRTVGYNQIRSVYLQIWQADEQERVWNEFENMVFGEQRRNDRVRKFYMVEEDI